MVYCAEDPLAPGSSSSSTTSLRQAPSRADARGSDEGRMARVAERRRSGKDRAAVMMSGHHADQRWYWNGKQFVTDLAARNAPRSWRERMPLSRSCRGYRRGAPAAALLLAKGAAGDARRRGKVVGAGTLRARRRSVGFRASPAVRRRHARAAAGGLESGDEARERAHPGPPLDQPVGDGLCRPCLRPRRSGDVPATVDLDREIGDFLSFLDRKRLDYAVALSADHGGSTFPSGCGRGVTGAARVDPALGATAMGKRIGQTRPVGPGADRRVQRRRIHRQGAQPRPIVRASCAKALARYRAHPQVAAAYSRDAGREDRHAVRQPGRLDARAESPRVLRCGNGPVISS